MYMTNWFHLPTFITGICSRLHTLAFVYQIRPVNTFPPDKHITNKHRSDESSQFLPDHGNQRVAEILLPTSCPNTKFMTLFLCSESQKRAKQDVFFVRPDIAFCDWGVLARVPVWFDYWLSTYGRECFLFITSNCLYFHPLVGEMGWWLKCQYFDSGPRSAWQEISFSFNCIVLLPLQPPIWSIRKLLNNTSFFLYCCSWVDFVNRCGDFEGNCSMSL